MDIDVATIVLLYGVLVISLVVHEASHALVALLGGDRTAYLGGQVTLNPVPHMRREPFGTIVLPLAMLVMSNGNMCFGYAHAPYDPVWAYHHPKRAALMAAAGPLANMILAALAFTVLKILIITEVGETQVGPGVLEVLRPVGGNADNFAVAAIRMASTFLFLNVLLALINLMPLPPFDGAGIVEGLFPRQTRNLYDLIRSQFFFMILGLIVLYELLPHVLWPVLGWIYRLL